MKVVRLSALRTCRLYPQEIFWYSFLLEAGATGRIISMTPSGIEPATFLFVAYSLTQLRHRVRHHFNRNFERILRE
jgi:hypothetical protein